jgi:hypothetical protein
VGALEVPALFVSAKGASATKFIALVTRSISRSPSMPYGRIPGFPLALGLLRNSVLDPLATLAAPALRYE